MSIITEANLKNYRNSTRFYSATLNESLNEFKNESKSLKIKVFLSHKHDELEVLDGAIPFLKKEGVDVYVDWMDEGMPKTTNGTTAKRIKEKIKENDKFIFLATEAAINSKWCNWELGLGDAAKFIENIAIFPVRSGISIFSGSEYFEIYPYITYEDGNSKYNSGLYIPKGYYVKFPAIDNSHRILKLSDWLKK